MKTPIVFLAAITLSTAVFAGNIQQDTKSSGSMHSGMDKEATLYGMSEVGMEARLDMMTEKGRAFHRALEQDQKNTAG